MTDEIGKLKREVQSLEGKISGHITFFSIIKSLSLSCRIDEIVNTILKTITGILKIEQYCLMLWNEEKLLLKNSSINCLLNNDGKAKGITLKAGEGLSGKVYQTGELLYIKNKDM